MNAARASKRVCILTVPVSLSYQQFARPCCPCLPHVTVRGPGYVLTKDSVRMLLLPCQPGNSLGFLTYKGVLSCRPRGT